MKRLSVVSLGIAVITFFAANSAYATLVQFDDGRLVTHTGAVIDPISGNSMSHSVSAPTTVGSYTEEGMTVAWGGAGSFYNVFVGDYYGRQDGVMHWHHVGNSSAVVRFSLLSGGLFNLWGLTLTSNTTLGGGAATGFEDSHLLTSTGVDVLLPSNNWGSVGGQADAQLTLNLTGIQWFEFTSSNTYCLGVDNISFDPVPEPATLILLGSGLLVSLGLRRRPRQ